MAAGPGPVVYLVLSHSRIPQLLRLVRVLRAERPDAVVVVHHDGHREPLDGDAARAAGADHVIDAPAPVRWGDLSTVEAVVRSLRWIEDHVDYDWVVQLSGQDYPTRPLAELEQHLRAGEAQAYVRHARVGSPGEDPARSGDAMARRYFYRYRRVPGGAALSRLLARRGAPAPVTASSAPAAPTAPAGDAGAGPGPGGRGLRNRVRAAVARGPVHVSVLPRGLGVKVGWRARSTPFTADHPCWKGSFWATLSRPAVRELLDQLDHRPELLRHYRRTLTPDESVVPTVLANSPAVRLSGEPLRFVSWVDGAAHPRTLGVADLAAIEASDAFVARKFDELVDAEVLDALDRHRAAGRATPT